MPEPQDFAQKIQDLVGDNPRCVICGSSTRHLEGAVFCSRGCEHKAMMQNHGTVGERMVQKAMTPDPFYLQTRIVDGGLWPGANHRAKVTRRQQQIRREF